MRLALVLRYVSAISQSGESDDAEYEIRADERENILYLRFSGSLMADEMDRAAKETVEVAETLDEGFGIINDISEFTPPDPTAAEAIKEAQVQLKEMGLGDVVRVVADETNVVTENAFQRRGHQAGYDAKTANSVDEAKDALSV